MLPHLRCARSGWRLSAAILLVAALVVGSFLGVAAALPSAAATAPRLGEEPATTLASPTSLPSAARTAPENPFRSTGLSSEFHLAPIHVPGRHPASWGKAGTPPGWLVPGVAGSNEVNPATGPIGPDDPVIQFYSDLNGSGGNVTWNITLPVDRNATSNQSDLYWALEFGMTVTAPSAWMDECFLELLLFPDSSWYDTGSDNGNWIGAVVGWQIQAASGLEDPCYYDPLYANGVPGPDFLNMSQGDRITVTMTGWPTNPAGELVAIRDLTNGNQSEATAYNQTGGYPLDPAYATNDVPDALQWSTGGDYPVVFGIITGRAHNPTVPSNNSLGGCSPGPPPPTSGNPAVPCPSYDPGSWINDTLHPLEIDPPMFFNATNHSSAQAEVAFSQTYGGLDEISNSAGSACVGRLGSAYCSYPWFSYSCALDAFEFGATDYPGVSQDFGKFDQYAQTLEHNAADIPFYPAVSYPVPTCSGPSSAVTVGPETSGGTVQFVNQTLGAETLVSGLGTGSYLVEATPPSGMFFADWATLGAVKVAYPGSPFTTITIAGNGSLLAVYSASEVTVAVTFGDNPSGEIAVSPGFLENTAGTVQTVPSGDVVEVVPGIYSVLAYAPQGFEFIGWHSSGAGGILASTELPLTWIVVTDQQTSASLAASFSRAPQTARVGIGAYDPANSTFQGGTVMLGAFASTHSKEALGSLVVGTYNLTATPAAGFRFSGWYYTRSAIMLNFSAATNITFENGTLNASIPAGVVLAIFTPEPVVVTFGVLAGAGGVVVAGFDYVASGGSLNLTPGQNYTLSAAPGSDWGFVLWSASSTSAIWNRDAGSWTEELVANKTATVDVTYSMGAAESVTFLVSPTVAGRIVFNGIDSYANGTVNSSVTGGETYLVAASANSGYVFSHWSTTGLLTVGPATASNSTMTVSGAGNLTAAFVPLTYQVTVLSNPAQGGAIELDGSTFSSDTTLALTPGEHTISAHATGESFDAWSASPGIGIADPADASTDIDVTGPGSITALFTPFVVAAPTATFNPVDVGVLDALDATAPSSGAYTIVWNGLPVGCATADLFQLGCMATEAGTYNASVALTDAWGEPASSPPLTLVVNPLPSVKPVLTLSTVDVGVPTNATAIVSGGTGPFEWDWTVLPPGCTAVNASSLTCAPSTNGTFTFGVVVMDRFGEGTYASVSLLVNPLPSIVLTVSTTSLTLGSSTLIGTSVSGGTAPLRVNYTGLPPGCTAPASGAFTCTPSQTGSYQVVATVTDAFGKQANQTVTIVVHAATTSVLGLSTTELAIGLVLLAAVAVVAFVALRRRPKKPTIVATPEVQPPPAAPPSVARPTSRPPLPEWSEETPPQEWHEDQ